MIGLAWSRMGWTLCLIVISTGCAHLSNRNSLDTDALKLYYPLSVGNTWTYQTSFQGQPQADLTVSITKEENGYYLDNRPSPSRIRFDSEGLRDGMVRYLIRHPIRVGNQWMSVVDVRTVEHYEILSINQTLKTPAGIFKDCLVVRMRVNIDEERSMENRMIFAPNVGVAEISATFRQGSKEIPQSHMVLKSFQLHSSGTL